MVLNFSHSYDLFVPSSRAILWCDNLLDRVLFFAAVSQLPYSQRFGWRWAWGAIRWIYGKFNYLSSRYYFTAWFQLRIWIWKSSLIWKAINLIVEWITDLGANNICVCFGYNLYHVQSYWNWCILALAHVLLRCTCVLYRSQDRQENAEVQLFYFGFQ